MTSASTRPFRFGVGPGGVQVDSARAWTGFARKLEDLGYSTIGVGDHLVGRYGPIAAMTAAAAATTGLRIGALTFCNDYRHPVVLAQEAATVDLLSDGRLELGLGAGWMHADYEGAGIPFDAAGVRIERLGEALRVVRGLWGDEPLTFDGAHYRLHAFDGRPKPVQRPHPPILVGGAGDRVLALAGREADIVGLNVSLREGKLGPEMGESATLRATGHKLAVVAEAVAQSGRAAAPPELQVYLHVAAIGPDAAAAGHDAARAALGLDATAAAESPHVLAGSVEQAVDTLSRAVKHSASRT